MVERVLLTGVSGVGKSTIAAELRARGHMAIDVDDGWCRLSTDGEWLWDEPRIEALLATEEAGVLFLAGAASNQVRFYEAFDHVVLLSAPADVIAARVTTRTNNPFGRSPGELRKILDDLDVFEPMIRRAATHEIITTHPADDVVRELLALVQPAEG